MKEDSIKLENKPANPMPLPIILGAGLVTIVTLYFYLSYASVAWFFQDDFGFIETYTHSILWDQLIDFSNFGRFLSRNIYWHYGISYFSYNAQYFYVFNFFTIIGSSILLYKIFEKQGLFAGIFAGLFYLLLPATIESYAWLSNSQHLLGHFFVLLFVYLFNKKSPEGDQISNSEWIRSLQLALVLMLGFASNIFVSMVISLPAWFIITNERFHRSKAAYFIFLFGSSLFALFFFKLSGNQTGPYSTAYTFETLSKNLDFYFGGTWFAAIWFISIICGLAYGLAKKNYFASWLFLASVAFFVPFAFFVHQRYGQYGALTYLFFLLGIWRLLVDSELNRRPNLIGYIGLVILIVIFCKSLEPPIRYLSQNPSGAEQKEQIKFLKTFSSENSSVKNYCFRSHKEVVNKTGVKEWDIPRDWWFLGFGKAFSIFVSHEKAYELIQNAALCDIVFVFKDGRLEVGNM